MTYHLIGHGLFDSDWRGAIPRSAPNTHSQIPNLKFDIGGSDWRARSRGATAAPPNDPSPPNEENTRLLTPRYHHPWRFTPPPQALPPTPKSLHRRLFTKPTDGITVLNYVATWTDVIGEPSAELARSQ